MLLATCVLGESVYLCVCAWFTLSHIADISTRHPLVCGGGGGGGGGGGVKWRSTPLKDLFFSPPSWFISLEEG